MRNPPAHVNVHNRMNNSDNKKDEEDRLSLRLKSMRDCQTPEELSFNIWTLELEQAMGDRSAYRKPFVNWVECYKSGEVPQWRYKTPMEVAEAIWYKSKSREDAWIVAVRQELVDWIERYKKGGIQP